MGKSQFKKKAAAVQRRHNPIRVPDSHLGNGTANAAKQADPAKEQAMLPIMSKLKSADAADRTWACAAVTNLIANDPATRRLFQGKNIVGALIERLTDGVEDVVVESSGALRNLAIDAGHEICGEMYNKDILTPLASLIPKIKSTIAKILASPPPASTTGGTPQVKPDDAELTARKFVYPLAENVLTLFWCLSETSNKTLLAINSLKIVPFLLAFLIHRSQIPQSVVLAASQCLYALSSDNYPCTKVLREDGKVLDIFLGVLRDQDGEEEDKKGKKKASEMDVEVDGDGDVKSEQGTMIKVLIAGTLRNMSSPKKPIVPDLDTKYILPLLQPLLDADLQAISETVTATAPQLPDAGAIAQKIDKKLKTDHVTPAELKLESIERRLATLMTALEVLTGVCAGLADELGEDSGDEFDRDGGRDEEDEERADEDMDAVDERMEDEDDDVPDEMEDLTDRKERGMGQATSTPLYGLVKLGLHTNLILLGRATPLSYPPAPDAEGRSSEPSIHPPTTSFLSAIHLRAYEALNNLLLSISAFAPEPSPTLSPEHVSEQLEPPVVWTAFVESQGESLAGLWTESFVAAAAAYSSPTVVGAKGQEIRLEVLDVIAGIWWSLARTFALGGLNVQAQEIATITEAFKIVTTPTARSRLINTLATLAMRKGVTPTENGQIAEFLLSVLGSGGTDSSADAETVVAAINGIIDVYADERSSYDVNFVQGGCLDKLVAVEQQIKQMSRAVDKRRDPDLRSRAEEAAENLSNFIAYRRSLQ